jgi:hypothetical protein
MPTKHNKSCLKRFPACQCLTCAKDEISCCFEHNLACNDGEAACTDYIREEGAEDAAD